MRNKRRNYIVLAILGLFAWGSLGASVTLIQSPSHLEYYTTFPSDPWTAGDWNKECETSPCCAWDAGAPTIVYSGTNSNVCTTHSIEGETVVGPDQSMLWYAPVGVSLGFKQRGGWYLHATPDEADTWTAESNITVFMNGNGTVAGWLGTGYISEYGLGASCDVGDFEDGEYYGLSVRQGGQDRQIRIWDFDATPPTNSYLPSTWNADQTCQCGWYDSGGASGITDCTNNYDITMPSDAKYDEHGGFGIYLDDNASPYNRVRIDQVWVSGEDW